MMLKPVLATASLLLAVSAASATTVSDIGAATVTYDETTPLGFIAGSFSSSATYGFHWTIPNSVTLVNNVQGTIAFLSVDLPSFTVTRNAGYNLSDVTATFGNPSFFDLGGTSNIEYNADVSVNGGPTTHIQGLVDFVVTNQDLMIGLNAGYFSQTGTLAGPFTSFAVTNASLLLTASVDANTGTLSSIVSNPQNQLEISFGVTPVPEPETAAMLLAGLSAMAWLTRRRRNV